MNIADKYNIEDPKMKDILNDIEKVADEGKSGNFESTHKEITAKDKGRMVEGKRYIDKKNKTMVIKIGNDLWSFSGTKL
jgi:hypothetical protein